MNEMEQSVVEKVRKLIALSQSDNKHEAESALLKAQELLAKHNLKLSEIEDDKPKNVKEEKTGVSFTKGKWKSKLARVIVDNFKCDMYFKTYRKHTIIFLGLEEDVAICKIMLEYAIEIIKKEVAKIAREYRKNGYSAKGIENDFALGFASGLAAKFEEQKAKNQEWGLVLVKPKEVQEAYNNIKFNGKGVKAAQFKGLSEVYFEGVEAGKQFDINRLTTKEEEDKTVLIG